MRVAVEVLLNTPLISDLIRKGEVHKIKEIMSRSSEQGMQTFDQSIYDLYTQGEISYDDAIAHADSANEVRLLIKLGSRSVNSSEQFGVSAESMGLDDLVMMNDN